MRLIDLKETRPGSPERRRMAEEFLCQLSPQEQEYVHAVLLFITEGDDSEIGCLPDNWREGLNHLKSEMGGSRHA